jgi:dTDP-4-dehydrorhamnose reductase
MHSSKKKILLIGHTGFLGSHLAHLLNDKFEVTTLKKEILDLSKNLSDAFKGSIESNQYDYAIICAAISDVEKCFQDQALSRQVNVVGMQDLLLTLTNFGVVPVFFSSDYVFSEKLTPYTESDTPNPKTIYGSQKLAIEIFIQQNFDSYLILRTSKLMSKTNHPKNILYPIIKNLKENKISNCFQDQFLNPVFVEDIAKVITNSINEKISGIFHLGTKTLFNRYELGLFLAKNLNYDVQLIKPTSMKDITFSEIRPNNNMLNCSLIEKTLRFDFCEIEDAFSDLKNIS